MNGGGGICNMPSTSTTPSSNVPNTPSEAVTVTEKVPTSNLEVPPIVTVFGDTTTVKIKIFRFYENLLILDNAIPTTT